MPCNLPILARHISRGRQISQTARQGRRDEARKLRKNSVKASGIGREGHDYSPDLYMETKNIALAKGMHKGARLAG